MDKKTLNDKQLEAVTTSSQYTRIIAGAGSGKTRVLTYRLAFLVAECGVAPWNILAITFTNKVAKEMKNRLLDLLPEQNQQLQIMTFHGFCYRFLRTEIYHLGFPTSFTIVDEEDQKKIVKDIVKDMGYNSRDEIIKESLNYIGSKKCAGKYPQSIDKDKIIYQREKECLEVFEKYEARKNAMYLLDFDDLLLMTIEIMQKYPVVREKWQKHYQHILIDEFQDTNNIEYFLVELLMRPSTALYVVGDPDQTIYTWRGANQNIILDLNKKYHAETIFLTQNYRSTTTILNAANKLIAHNKKREPKDLFTMKATDDGIEYMPAFRAEDEAEWIAKKILDMRAQNDFNFRQVAVLYRASYLTLPIEKTFNKYRIPYQIFGGLRFYQRKEIKDVLAYFRLLVNKKDDVSFERIINIPRRNVGETTLQSLKDAAKTQGACLYEFIQKTNSEEGPIKVKTMDTLKEMIALIEETRKHLEEKEELFSETLREFVNKLQYFEYLQIFDEDNSSERIGNVNSLFDDILNYVRDNPEGGFDEYLQNVALLSSQDDIEEGEYVSLMTIHTAKGLEFPIVFVMGINEGVFPSNRSLEESGHEGLEEERRLCYVAITRAMDRLFLSWNAEFSYVLGSPKIPSRFLKEAGITIEKRGTNYRSDFESERIGNKKKVPLFVNPPLANEGASWRKGDIVRHTTFGEGVITDVLGDKIIKVSFSLSGERLLLANHPSLTKIKQGEFDA